MVELRLGEVRAIVVETHFRASYWEGEEERWCTPIVTLHPSGMYQIEQLPDVEGGQRAALLVSRELEGPAMSWEGAPKASSAGLKIAGSVWAVAERLVPKWGPYTADAGGGSGGPPAGRA